jgi:hypothetical protein
MPRLIRIENSDGGGIYTRGEAHLYSPRANDYHPEPSEEGHCFRVGYDNCGFKDVAQLRKWFANTEGRRNLFKGNPTFAVVELETPEVKILDHQVIFHRKTATVVRTLEPEEYL